MNNLCSVNGCETKAVSKRNGLCQKHAKRMRKYGTTEAQKGSRGPLSERFWLYVNKDAANGCWEWMGALGPNGYGRTGDKNKPDLVAHRVSYTLTKGRIPEGKIIMHTCDNRKCVNPSHLVAGTYLENMQDMIRKGRDYHPIKFGEESPRAKLTEGNVREIRSSVDITDAEFARRFGVTDTAIRSARIGVTWRHIDNATSI
jgi:hypothetical protein